MRVVLDISRMWSPGSSSTVVRKLFDDPFLRHGLLRPAQAIDVGPCNHAGYRRTEYLNRQVQGKRCWPCQARWSGEFRREQRRHRG